MAGVLEFDGAAFWYDVDGDGPPLVYLHGGFSDASELDVVRPRYAEHFRVWMPERRGHGHTADTPGAYGFAQSAADTVALLERLVGGPADLVGFSDGATTALHVALSRPDLVGRLVLISGQFHHDGMLPDMFGKDPEQAAADLAGSPLAERYAKISPDGGEHFPVMAEKVLRMAMREPTLDVARLRGVTARTLVMCGDDDVVKLEHTLALYRGLPDAELAVVPGTSHVLITDKPDLVAGMVLDFLTREPVETRAPIRRRR